MNIASRGLLIVVLAALGAAMAEGNLRLPAACAGAAVGFSLVGLEAWLSRSHPGAVLGAAVGLIGGLLCALLVATTLVTQLPPGLRAVSAAMLVAGFAWLGVSLGVAHAASADHAGLGSRAAAPQRRVDAGRAPGAKVIDTSVIIDGRIVDVIAAGFVEGTLIIPQFILRELQQVADSSDPLKRNRGRKGLDVLKAIQVSDTIKVEVTDEDTPDVREVDGKLLWLAERRHAALLTNDYNLNKVAQLRGVQVLNVNDLANAVKPVVLPGEALTIQVIKEGKERNQGVGYLDDGTMVVVESGRRLIGQKADVIVSSVIQTNAGKMIFAASTDEPEPLRPPQRIARRGGDSDISVPPGPMPTEISTLGQG